MTRIFANTKMTDVLDWRMIANKNTNQIFQKSVRYIIKALRWLIKLIIWMKKLKLFFIMLLAARFDFGTRIYKRINISSYEQNFKDMIINKNPGGSYNSVGWQNLVIRK